MILDWVPSTGYFTLRVPRGEADPRDLMREHGLDFSQPRSTAGTAILMTKDHYAAATFAEFATPYARMELGHLLTQIEASRSKVSKAHIRCPADQELWPFQRADVEYCLRRTNSLVGDQPGLGKTPVAICVANEIRAKRVLVICPANIRLQWARRIREWSTMTWPYVVYPILTGARGVHPEAEWTIVSYDLARTPGIQAALARGLYDLIILDEAHYLKTSDSLRARAIFGGGQTPVAVPLFTRAGGIIALTGTPLPNRPQEAYTLTRALCWDAIDWMSEDAFKIRYNPRERLEGVRKDGTKYWYTREEAGRAGELQNRLRAHYMTRHLKRDVREQLKLPAYDIVLVDQTTAVKAALEAERLLDIDPTDPNLFSNADAAVLGQVAIVRHQMGLAIAPLAAEYVEMCLEGGEDKILLGAWHHDVMDILQTSLQKFGVLRIDGRTGPIRRQKMVDEFVADPTRRVLLGQTQAVGIGTDGLQAVCNHAVLAEYSWVPGENEQFIDRLDRGGQRQQVQAEFIVAPGSIGERMMASGLRKLNNTDKVLDRQFVL